MGELILTDEQIKQLLSVPKKITTPNARWKEQRGSKQRNFLVTSEDQTLLFSLFLRQNQRLTQGFSCGLLYHHPSGEKIMLTRYNGSDHPHHNALDGSRCDFPCHIHMATSQYMASGRKAEHFALSTQRYADLRGAAAAIAGDCNIAGLKLSCLDEEGDNGATDHQQLDLGLE
jgi:hypothetical protein